MLIQTDSLTKRCLCNFADFQKFESELVQQEQKVSDCIRLGEDIQKRAHSDAIPTLKHWLTILEARWVEVKNLSSQRRKRLRDSLDVSQSNAHLLDELTKWLSDMETTLKTGSQKPIPENIPIVDQLLQDHAVSPAPLEHLFLYLLSDSIPVTAKNLFQHLLKICSSTR